MVLDEIETLQRVRGDVREKALNALRQLIDEVDAGRFPGLYLMITGTPAFYDGPQGVQRLAPLAQRLATDFGDPRFDNPRAVQIRLTGFDLRQADRRWAAQSATCTRPGPQRRASPVGRATTPSSRTRRGGDGRARRPGRHRAPSVPAQAGRAAYWTGSTSSRTSIPAQHYQLTLSGSELTEVERNAWQQRAADADDVELDL